MSPEIRAMLEAKHKERQVAMSPKARTGTKKRKSPKRRRKAKKASVGIRTMKELDIKLRLKKHGKPTVKSFRAKY